MSDEIESTEIGLGSGGRFSRPDDPVCAGCEHPITDEQPVWECGTQWHRACLPPGFGFPPEGA